MLEGRSVFYLATTILLLYCCGNLWYSQQLAPHFSASGNINNESLQYKNLSDDEIFNSEMGHSRGVHNNDVNITTIQIGGDVKVDQKCREYSAETLRAHGVHWKVDAINASVTMFPLSRTDEKRGKGTLGVHIVIGRETNNLSSSFNSSQQQYTHMVGREALRHEQSTLLSNKNSCVTSSTGISISSPPRSLPDAEIATIRTNAAPTERGSTPAVAFQGLSGSVIT